MVAVATSGCRADSSGAQTPEAAVERLLAAAVEGDLVRAREVTSGLSDEDLESNLAEIAAFVGSAGGLAKVTAIEDRERRMGSHSIVEVLVSDSLDKVEFDVLQHGGRYRVAVGPEVDPDDEVSETTDPNPPATSDSQLGDTT